MRCVQSTSTENDAVMQAVYTLMEVCRRLLPVLEECEDSQLHGCVMDVAASPADEAAQPPKCHAAIASPDVVEEVNTADGLESPPRQHSVAGAIGREGMETRYTSFR